MNALNRLAPDVGMKQACIALNLNRSSIYRQDARQRHLPIQKSRSVNRPAPLALSDVERTGLLEVLNSPRFADRTPYAVYAVLLDEGRYLGSVRTMYRLLKQCGQSCERRQQRHHPVYQKPELLAIQQNQVWSWDITKLKGAQKWTYFHLYVILDIFSRYVVGWMIAHRESAELAQQLIADTAARQAIEPSTLTLHADRGSSMRSKSVAALLVDLEITKTHSRPYVSDDNPFSESQFKTLKYRPEFPQRFGSIEDARTHCQQFFQWYNHEHYHSGIGFMTPASVHYDQANELLEIRKNTLRQAFSMHPKRFKNRLPQPPELPSAVWINPPLERKATIQRLPNNSTLN